MANTALPVFDVRHYGAKGDGSTVDTTAISRAIAAAQAYTLANSGCYATVEIPRGVFITAQVSITGDRIRINNRGTLKFAASDTTSDNMIDVTGDYVELKGGVYDCNNAGDASVGNCIRIIGEYGMVKNVSIRNALDQGLDIHDGSRYTTAVDVVIDGCPRPIRVRGDNVLLERVRFLNFTDQHGVTIDPSVIDAQSITLRDVYGKTTTSTWEAFILVDPGDGAHGSSSSDPIVCGAPSNQGGLAKYTIQAGHGFKAGDGFIIASSGTTDWNRVHKIVATGGDVFVRRLSSTTLALYDTAANALASPSTTGRITFGDVGTPGGDFYITTPLGGRHEVQCNSSGVDTTNHILTTDDAHGFQTGEPARITIGQAATVLPAGSLNAGWVILNSDYLEPAGSSSSTTYIRPKRIEKLVIDGLVCEAPNSSLNAGNLVKIANVNNLFIDANLVNPTDDSYSAGDSDIQTLRLAGNIRKCTLRNVKTSNGLFMQTRASIVRLLAEQCTFGDGHNLPLYGIEGFKAYHSIFRQCTFRSNTAAIEYDMRDEDLEWAEFDDCVGEGFKAGSGTSSTAWYFFKPSDPISLHQCVTGGKFFFHPNCRRRNTLWSGSEATFNDTTDVVTITQHGLRTGDTIYFEVGSGGTLPTNVGSGTVYFVRVTGNNTFTLHTTEAAATLATSTPFNLGSNGATIVYGKSPIFKLGANLTIDGVRALLFRSRHSAMDLEDVVSTNAAASSMFMPLGLQVWNPNATANDSPGWVITEASTPTTTIATLTPMPALGNINALTANVTEVGNIGGGEDNLITYTLPADTLSEAGMSIEIEAGFTFAANGNTKTIKLYLGSTDLLALSGSAQNGGSYFVRAIGIRDASNILKVAVVGSTYGGSGTPLGNIGGNVFNHTADMTTALTIKGTGTSGSSATDDVVMEFLRVKTVPAP